MNNKKITSESKPVLFVLLLIITLTTPSFTGCSLMISSASTDLADNLSNAILNNNDPETVETGGTAYLIMIDSLLEGDPDNVSLLRIASSLYSSYSGIFVKEPERTRRLTRKAVDYGFRAACSLKSKACDLQNMKYPEFVLVIGEIRKKDIPVFYALGASWASWIQANRDDLIAVAQLSRVETIMKRIVELDESYQGGGAHIYLGVLSTWLPPAMGGKPEIGKVHFRRAIELSESRNLMAKVMYARYYARLMFDRELHDRLLNEVLKSDPGMPGMTLINILAQQEARELLEGGKDYF